MSNLFPHTPDAIEIGWHSRKSAKPLIGTSVTKHFLALYLFIFVVIILTK